MGGEIMQAIAASSQPRLAARAREKRGRVVLGTVDGDIHDIGKDIVGTMLGLAGYEVVDLGVDVAASSSSRPPGRRRRTSSP